MDVSELLLHPLRLRIVHAFAGEVSLSTAQIGQRLPDVPKATLYRHVALLVDAGILKLESERRVQGAVERRYRLDRERARFTQQMVDDADPEQLRTAFAVAMSVLLTEFTGYTNTPDIDLARDAVGFRQHAIWLTDDERDRLIEGMRAAIAPVLLNTPSQDRAAYLLSPILFPVGRPAATAPDH